MPSRERPAQKAVALDKHRFFAHPRRLNRRRQAAGAAADDRDVADLGLYFFHNI